MKIAYKILWLDDKIDEFIDDELIEELKEYLIDEGFKPDIIPVRNNEEFFEKLNDSYDLIMTDYHMDEMQGNEVIETIRNGYALLTEVLFYTARADLGPAINLSRVTFLETNKKRGDHQQLVLEEAKNLIALTIRKFQHIVAMRGMIMHETSALDSLMLDTLRLFIDNPKNDTHTNEIAVLMLKELETLFSRKLKNIQIWRRNLNLKQASKDNFVFSASFKIKALGCISRALASADMSEDYNLNINQIRNQFAHALLEEDENGYQRFRDANTIFDEALCKKIRKDIGKHEVNLRELSHKVAQLI